MKPRFRNLLKASLPALIVVPALMAEVHAGVGNIITPDAEGNVVVSGDYDELNGSDWSVLASGGTTSPFTVTLKKGALLTGNEWNRNGIEVSAPRYTIDNFGSLNTQQYGVLSRSLGTVVNNKAGALIQGGFIGVQFSGEQIVDARVMPDLETGPDTVINDGVIIGNQAGVAGNNGLVLHNNESGEITGNFGSAVYAQDGLLLSNDGILTGKIGDQFETKLKAVPFKSRGGDGITTFNDARITNHGTITGDSNGITAYQNLALNNYGEIKGKGFEGYQFTIEEATVLYGGVGVQADSGASIVNHSGGAISGTNYGIRAGEDLDLSNYGSILGNNEAGEGIAGVSAGKGAVISNRGVIFGDVDGIVIGATTEEVLVGRFDQAEAKPSTITNHGYITGGSGHGILGSDEVETITNDGFIAGPSAIDLAGGDDVIHLDYGSEITGDVTGGDGKDVMNFHAGSESFFEITNIVHGNVYGVETITKSDRGFAFIGAPGESFDVFTDRIEVSGGGLIINGNLASISEEKTQVALSNGGRLDGTGKWNADLVVTSGGLSAGGTNSLLAPGEILLPPVIINPPVMKQAVEAPVLPSAVGTLTINGDVSFGVTQSSPKSAPSSAVTSPGSHIRVDINPQTKIINGVNSDLIIQNGAGNSFDLGNVNLRLAPTDINKTLTNGGYTIVDSDNALKNFDLLGTLGVQFNNNAPDTGSFFATEGGENSLNTVLTRYFSTVETADGGTDLVVRIDHDFEGLPGLTENQAAVGGALDGLVSSPDPLIQDFIAALDYSDLDAVQSTLASLDPSASLGLVTSVLNSNYRLNRLAQDHLAAIRGNGEKHMDSAASTTDAKGTIIPGESSTRWTGRANAWGSLSYDGQDYNASGSRPEFDGDAGAFTAGFDWLVAPNFVLGAVLDGSKGDYDGGGTSSDTDSYRGAVYGTWGAATGFHADFLLGYGDHSLDSERDTGGLLSGSTSNDTDADSLQAMLTAGYTMGDSRLKHGPFAGFEYQNVDVDGYTQDGLIPVGVDGYEVDSLRGLIGYRVNASAGIFRPYASVAYAHEFEDGTNSVDASLGGVGFSVKGIDQSSAILISIGTGISLSESLTLDLGYRGDIATDDGISSNGGSLGVNYSF